MSDAGFVIRAAVEADIDVLAVIESAGDAQFAAAGHPEFHGGETISRETALTAIAEDRLKAAVSEDLANMGAAVVVGWLMTGVEGDEFSIAQVAVLPTQQKSGIGRALMGHAISTAIDLGHRSVLLDTQADIPWNKPWYERLGFEVVPKEQWTDAMRLTSRAQQAAGLDWSTRVHMRLDLGDTLTILDS
jgi:ribosomal protein S18 acetylase RimI-like enzyme